MVPYQGKGRLIMFELLDEIIDYESGTLGYDETITLFQKLVDNGLCWQLQGHYGRTASALLESGLITRA